MSTSTATCPKCGAADIPLEYATLESRDDETPAEKFVKVYRANVLGTTPFKFTCPSCGHQGLICRC